MIKTVKQHLLFYLGLTVALRTDVFLENRGEYVYDVVHAMFQWTIR